MNEPSPVVEVKALNDYNVTLELQVWLKNERMHLQRRFELHKKVFNALNEAAHNSLSAVSAHGKCFFFEHLPRQ